MFRPVVAIIRSLSFDTLKIILYNKTYVCLFSVTLHDCMPLLTNTFG